jgi:hypothetical protein
MRTTRTRSIIGTVAALTALLTFVAPSSPAHAQRAFDSADAAVTALVDAAKNGDSATLRAIFGPDAEEVLLSGDPIADQEAREGFAARAAERTHLERVGDDFAVLSVGNDDWPFAIPLTKGKAGWIFNLPAGKTELWNRRVGRNELDTIQVMEEYVIAQREYARRQKATTGVAEYAQRVRSTPGKRDGLYWEARAGEDESPMGPLMASATREGYHGVGSGEPQLPL